MNQNKVPKRIKPPRMKGKYDQYSILHSTQNSNRKQTDVPKKTKVLFKLNANTSGPHVLFQTHVTSELMGKGKIKAQISFPSLPCVNT